MNANLECRRGRWRAYRLVRGRLYFDHSGGRTRVLSFCLDDPAQGPVVELPIFAVGGKR